MNKDENEEDANEDHSNDDEDIDIISEVINTAIGSDNYDIGHIVGTGGGGLASFAVVCSQSKAEGVTGSDSPTGDAFHVDYADFDFFYYCLYIHTQL